MIRGEEAGGRRFKSDRPDKILKDKFICPIELSIRSFYQIKFPPKADQPQAEKSKIWFTVALAAARQMKKRRTVAEKKWLAMKRNPKNLLKKSWKKKINIAKSCT